MLFTKTSAIIAALAATAFAVVTPDYLENRQEVDASGCIVIKNGLGCPVSHPINCKDFANGDHHCCAHIAGCTPFLKE